MKYAAFLLAAEPLSLFFVSVCMSNQQTVAHAGDAYVLPFEQLRMTDVESVGGKNASLGEMISQ